jgi:hypothetical protein
MNKHTQELNNLDAETRAVIEERIALEQKDVQGSIEIESLAASIRKRRRERRRKILGEDLSALLDRAKSIEAEEGRDTKDLLDAAKKVQLGPELAQINTRQPVIATSSRRVASLTPYFVYEFNIDTGAFITGIYGTPPEPFPVEALVFGSGSGRDDADRHTSTIEVSWLFRFVPTQGGFYHFFPTTAYFGEYTAISDDDISTSLQAHVSMRLKGAVSAGGTSGVSMPAATQSLLNRDSDNINEVRRQIGAPGAGGEAQLNILAVPLGEGVPAIVTLTHELYVYARGSGTTAYLDFRSGQHRVGPVWCYVFGADF